MTRSERIHSGAMPGSTLTQKQLAKQEFGRRIEQLMREKGWNQSELARRAGIPRDSVSTYIRGVTLPTPKSLQALSSAFGMQPADILPNSRVSTVDEDSPSLEMRVSTSAPNEAWLRVNRQVTLLTAARVIELIQADTASAQTSMASRED